VAERLKTPVLKTLPFPEAQPAGGQACGVAETAETGLRRFSLPILAIADSGSLAEKTLVAETLVAG